MKKLILLSLLLPLIAKASGTTIGNGGDALVCVDPASGTKTVGLYDYYETENRFGRKIDFSKEPTVIKKVHDYIERIRTINPSRADVYSKWADDFFSEATFVAGVELVDIPDTGNGFFPHHCSIRQLAVQRTPKFPGEKRYLISKDLWDLMDDQNRAGLVMHELILRDSVGPASGNLNSENARYFHANLISHGFDGLSLREYHEQLKLVQMAWADTHDGIPFRLFDIDSTGIKPRKILYSNDSTMREVPFDAEAAAFGVDFVRNFAGRVVTLSFELGSPSGDRSESAWRKFMYFPSGQIEWLPLKPVKGAVWESAGFRVTGEVNVIHFTSSGSIDALFQMNGTGVGESKWVVEGPNSLRLDLSSSSLSKVAEFWSNGNLRYLDVFSANRQDLSEPDSSFVYSGSVYDPVQNRILNLLGMSNYFDRAYFGSEDGTFMGSSFGESGTSFVVHEISIQAKAVMYQSKGADPESAYVVVLAKNMSLRDTIGNWKEYAADTMLFLNSEGLVISSYKH